MGHVVPVAPRVTNRWPSSSRGPLFHLVIAGQPKPLWPFARFGAISCWYLSSLSSRARYQTLRCLLLFLASAQGRSWQQPCPYRYMMLQVHACNGETEAAWSLAGLAFKDETGKNILAPQIALGMTG